MATPKVFLRRNDSGSALRGWRGESRLNVDRLLVVGSAALAAGVAMLTAGLAVYPEPVAGIAPVIARPAAVRAQTLVATPSHSRASEAEPLQADMRTQVRVDPVAPPPAPEAAQLGEPFSGHDPARTDRTPKGVDYDPDDGPTFLKRMATRAVRRPIFDTADYPRSPQEELPLAARVGGDEAPAGAYHAIIAAHTASGSIDGGNDELSVARRDDSP